MLRTPTAVVISVSFSETHLSSGDAQFLRTCQSVRLLSRAPGVLAKRAGRRSSCTAEFARQQGSRSSGSGVQDAQETELAAADQQAKQDLYAQLLERRHSSQLSEVSASNSAGSGTSQTAKAESSSTELIFRLERRGEGWGEEIFPHLVVEQRPWTSAAKRDRNRSSRPKPWTVLPWSFSASCLYHKGFAACLCLHEQLLILHADRSCTLTNNCTPTRHMEGSALEQVAALKLSGCAFCHRPARCTSACSSTLLLLLADALAMSAWQLWILHLLSLSCMPTSRRGVLSSSCSKSAA